MAMNNETKHHELFKKAQEDELSIGAILRDERGAPSTACFLSQQMAEKYLKGMLVFYDKRFPKIHDLLKLEDLLLHYEKEIKNYEDDLVLLNRYYVETRYTGDYPEFTFQEARKAYEAAKKIKEFVLGKIK
ncbi:HEPN domain-containing protein [Candidatus Azambacteria bacterium]|nr:HEPN domain-containing protein [Candidatus Azambacteria bacterium]